MRKALVIIFAVAILGVLATFVLPDNKQASSISSTPKSSSATVTNSSSSSPTSSQSMGNSMMNSKTLKDGTYTGSTETNPYNDVQVKITVSSGKISDVSFAKLTYENPHSQEIVSYAAPRLKSQTLSAQSASIDGVSGATYVSQSYVTSLQAAIDQAAM